MARKKERIKITHNWKLLIVIIVILILLIVIVLLIPKQENNGNNVEKECVRNEDCVKQKTSCCSCNMGGEEVCMSRKNATLLQNQIGDCKGIMCIALYNCRETSCSCVGGKCIAEDISLPLSSQRQTS